MIGITNAGFGGGSSGLKIVTGLTAPVKPKENMIWVETDKAGKDSVFAETEPENPAEGLIWFTVKAYFGIITETKVYTEEAWVSVNAYMYLSGAWTTISNAYMYLYKYGDQCKDVSGGWAAKRWYVNSGYVGASPSVSSHGDYITITGGASSAGDGMYYMAKSISMASYSTLYAEISGNGGGHKICISTVVPTNETYGSGFTTKVSASASLSNGIVELDVRNYTGKMYIAFRVSATKSFNFHACYLQ